MTWDEFKTAVEAAGVRGVDQVDWIDTSGGEGVRVGFRRVDTYEVLTDAGALTVDGPRFVSIS